MHRFRIACLMLLFTGCWIANALGVTVQGYTDRRSYNQGDTITFFLSADQPVTNYSLNLYNVYGRSFGQVSATIPTQVPATGNPATDGFGYQPTLQFQIPSTMHSGMYWLDQVPFYVKDPSKTSDVVIVAPTNTVNAYSQAGGSSLYTLPRIQTVSFERQQKWYPTAHPFSRWFESQDYSYRYVVDTDLEHYDEMSGSKLLILVAADEYWTREARQNFDRYLREGGNVLILAGNVMHRPIELDDRDNPTKMTELRLDPRGKGSWLDPYLNYPPSASTGGDFWWGGYGNDAPSGNTDLGWDGYKIVADDAPYLQGTGLTNGDIISVASHEYDAPPITGFDPLTGIPQIDKQKLGFYDIRLIGYDRAWSNWRKQEGYGGWWEFQPTPQSGKAIVVGSTDWTWSTLDIVKSVNQKMIDYLLDWTPADNGDFDDDGKMTITDLDLLGRSIRAGSTDAHEDTNRDGRIDRQDYAFWVESLQKLAYGDVNLDGVFMSDDLIELFQAGEYEDALQGNSTWRTGDFDGDGEFLSGDLVVAFRMGRYEGAAGAIASVPEPRQLGWLTGVALLSTVIGRRKRRAERDLD